MFRLSVATTLAAFVSLAAGCTYPPGNHHNPNYVGPTRIANTYAEYTDTKRADYRASDPCIAAFVVASAHPSADSLGDASTRKATALADLRRGIEASTGDAEAERACAVNTVDLFQGSSLYPEGSLFEPSPNLLTCLRTTYEAPRFATAAELDACLAAN